MSNYLNHFAAARDVVLPCLYTPPGTQIPTNAGFRRKAAEAEAKMQARRMLRVSSFTLPSVERAVAKACQHLRVPREAVHAFVSPALERNAHCLMNADEPVIVFGSALVELMTEKELTCVAGHEIGHFLLPEAHLLIDHESAEGRLHSRAAEITMDRIGLVSCGDVQAACLTEMKLLCGLKDPHLRADVTAFIEEARKAFDGTFQREEDSTHPPTQLRLRAILEFANSDAFHNPHGRSGGKPIAEINQSVTRLLHEHIDRHIIAEMTEPVLMAKAWLYCLCKSHGAEVTTHALNRIKPDVDEVRLQRAWASLAGFKGEQICNHAHQRFVKSIENSHGMAPQLTQQLMAWIKSEPAMNPIKHLLP